MRILRYLLAVLIMVCLPVHAAVLTWTATLNGAQEIPPTASAATGFGRVQFDNVTNILQLDLFWAGLTGTVSAGHIHCCVATPPANAGVVLDLALGGKLATDSFSASYDLDLVNPFTSAFTTANGGTALLAFNALAAAMDANQGRAYYNIHTAVFPGGEIRGNLASIPEPSSVIGVLSGIAVLVLRRRSI